MRLFFALTPTAATLQAIAQQLRPRQARSPTTVRWLEPTHWHITLRFLGQWPASGLSGLGAAAAAAAAVQRGPLDLTFSEIGAFPKPSAARVVWMGTGEPSQDLRSLAGALDGAVVALGATAEQRAFRPHLTVARLKVPADVRSLLAEPPWVSVPTLVHELVLFESFTTPGGSRYEERGRWGLGERK